MSTHAAARRSGSFELDHLEKHNDHNNFDASSSSQGSPSSSTYSELPSYNTPASRKSDAFILTRAHLGWIGVALFVLVGCLALSGGNLGKSNSQHAYCRWVFDSYLPSEYETTWRSNVGNWQENVCDVLQKPEHSANSETILRRSLELSDISPTVKWATEDTRPFVNYDRNKKSDDLFSRMQYRRECSSPSDMKWEPAPGSGVQLIEPLWDMLRDPFDKFCWEKKLHMKGWPAERAGPHGQSKMHIIPQGYAPYAYTTTDGPIPTNAWRSHGQPPWYSSYSLSEHAQLGTLFTPPQTKFLDLGSSYFGSWGGDAASASGSWMYKTYVERGLKFGKYVAVELEALSPEEAYKQLPADLVGVYTLMNVGLTFGKGDKLNAIDLIRSLSKKEDFFILKLDIDSADLELPL